MLAMMRALLTGLVLLVASRCDCRRRSTEPCPGSTRGPRPRGDQLLRSTMVAAHNEARRQYGVGPLAWDDGLARDAAVYARYLARTGRFEHDPQAWPPPAAGRESVHGNRGRLRYADMIRPADRGTAILPARPLPCRQPDRQLGPRRTLHADHMADVAAGRLRDRVQPRQRLSGVPLSSGGNVVGTVLR